MVARALRESKACAFTISEWARDGLPWARLNFGLRAGREVHGKHPF